MQNEADAQEAPEVASPTDAEPTTLPANDAVGEVEPTTDVETAESPATDPNLDPLAAFELEKAAFLAQPETEPTGEAVEEASLEAEVTDEPTAELDEQAEPLETDEAEDDVTAETDTDAEGEKKAAQYRLRPRSEVGELAFQLMKKDRFLDEEAAFAQAREKLNPTAETEDAEPEATDEKPTVEVPAEFDSLTADEMADKIADLKLESLEKFEGDADFDAYTKSQREIVNLERVQRAVAHREAQETVKAESLAQQFEQSKENVVNKYPVAKDPDSEFSQKLVERYEALVALNDPMVQRGDAPEVLADLVAKALGVSPHSEKAPAQAPAKSTATPPKAQSQVPPRRTQAAQSITPASGANRTQSHQPTVEAALSRIQTPDDYEALKASVLEG